MAGLKIVEFSMPLLSLNQVDFSVGGPLLLQGVQLSLDAGERIA
jgi:ATP-binding cassette subfamily F protein uup